MARENKPDKIIVHHSAYATRNNQFAAVDDLHRERFNFPSSLGKFCGYHYFIEKEGLVIQARKDSEEGAHCLNQNLSSIGICLAGNFDFQQPTAAQRNAFVKLADSLIHAHAIKSSEIYPHRFFRATSCYGITLKDSWARDAFADYAAGNLRNSLWLLVEQLEKLLTKKQHENL